MCMGRHVQVMQNWWLSQWANRGSEAAASGASPETRHYLTIYIILGLAGVGAQVCCGSSLASMYVLQYSPSREL